MIDLTALKQIADSIVADAFAEGKPELAKNYAEAAACAGLPFVAAHKIDGVISDTTAIRAQCLYGRAIQIYVPCDGWTDAANIVQRQEVVRTVFGALAHELTHVRQCGADRVQYGQTVARQAEYEKAGGDRFPADWLQGYYSEPLEFEAHAVQLAAELQLLGSEDPAADPFGSWIGATEVSRRVHGRLFPGGTGSTDAEEWWNRFTAEVARFLEAWKAETATVAVIDTASAQIEPL